MPDPRNIHPSIASKPGCLSGDIVNVSKEHLIVDICTLITQKHPQILDLSKLSNKKQSQYPLNLNCKKIQLQNIVRTKFHQQLYSVLSCKHYKDHTIPENFVNTDAQIYPYTNVQLTKIIHKTSYFQYIIFQTLNTCKFLAQISTCWRILKLYSKNKNTSVQENYTRWYRHLNHN